MTRVILQELSLYQQFTGKIQWNLVAIGMLMMCLFAKRRMDVISAVNCWGRVDYAAHHEIIGGF
jgi:hypothetical protein